MIIAFSLYSKIPMPAQVWDDDCAERAISFLPFIGIVIGALSYMMLMLAGALGLPVFFTTVALTLIPVLVTGGFHLDGFLDVQDALHSYQPGEKKLEIMKDPHIGAFAVISAGELLLVWMGFLYLAVSTYAYSGDLSLMYLYCISFVPARALCAFTSIIFTKARKDGLLNMETKKSRRGDLVFLILQGAAAIAAMLFINLKVTLLAIAVMLIHLALYRRLCIRNFGGVTGDTAGFFVVSAETALLILLGICSVLAL